ncbi:peptide/nickel transport system permease protein [Allocatelliglobosispora scoriae]|uniref:Peptide/nickel transport system permease protein n=1 Tax=Allocatelliglobosispora scoriae TaxID=643052 RepID=A0A841BLJ0_9ACTN|nr:ABC transporter permease [Allocatelliglobosispora scoriae]MBB5868228.1 peptide/nickel transport system permease protein [Allocatelliglobosispora scoriae]
MTVLTARRSLPALALPTRRWRFRPGLILGVGYLVLLVVAAIAPGLLTSHDPLEISTAGAFVPPSGEHLLGTDQSGRDILARMIYGARSSLIMGLGATAIGVTVGSVVGLIAGLANRFVEGTIMRLIDVTLSIPDLLMALVVVTLLGTGTVNALFAVAFASIPYYARLLRAQAHVVRRSTYVEAATALGLRRWTVIRRHVLPNAFKPLIGLATIGIGNAIGAGASLSFLGLGTKPPAPEWGNMLSLGIQYISNDWLMVAIPGLAITLTVLAVTVVGRDLKRRSEGRAV